MQRHDWSKVGAIVTPLMQAKSSQHVLQVLCQGVGVCGEVEKRRQCAQILCVLTHRKIPGVEGVAEDIAPCGGEQILCRRTAANLDATLYCV